jgi:hypothetical protein
VEGLAACAIMFDHSTNAQKERELNSVGPIHPLETVLLPIAWIGACSLG